MIISSSVKFHSIEDKERFIERSLIPVDPEVILDEWKRILNQATREQDIQDFLELHPELLPGLFDFHNGPLNGIIVSKFPFGADYKCDFAFVTRHSAALQFTFVEIEDPTTRVFNKDGSFSQAFNHARQQIADWKVWAEKNINTLMNMFSPMFEFYNAWDDYKDFRFYLVCGRRSEIESDKKRKERWSSIHAGNDKNTVIMSYDRLNSFEKVNERLIVCSYQDRSFYAKSELLQHSSGIQNAPDKSFKPNQSLHLKS
jgi:hypothetical protein